MRSNDGSSSGHWVVTDCHPDDVACGGGSHRLLISPRVDSVTTCLHELPTQGWLYCSGELVANGICTDYASDDTIKFDCI